jgi:MoaA/NifB/PqqE/SkfB family radical SAM enzyme
MAGSQLDNVLDPFDHLPATLTRAAWVASHTYSAKDQSGEALAVVSNAKTHEFLLLEDEAALIWQFIEQGITVEDLLGKLPPSQTPEDLQMFLLELEANQLITSADVGASENSAPLRADTPPAIGQSVTGEPSDYQRLEDYAINWASAQGYLCSAMWEMTYRCNERCVHCFNPGAAHSPDQKPNRNTDELSFEEAKQLLDELHEAGVFKLTLSGGEVFVRKDFMDIVAHARGLGMQVNIYTNGLLLSEARLQQLCDLWPETVSISIYSTDPLKHDQVTNVIGSYETSVEALKRLHAAGIKTQIKTPLMGSTVDGFMDVADLAKEIKARSQLDVGISAGNDGAKEPLDLAIQSHAKLVALSVTEGTPIYVGGADTNYGRMSKDKNQPVCGAGSRGMSIGPSGSISPCVAMPLETGDFRTEGFVAGWKGAQSDDAQGSPAGRRLKQWRETVLSDYEECGTHDRCDWCAKCPGMSMGETGDPLKASAVQCRIANAQMEAAKLVEAGHSRETILAMHQLPRSFGRQDLDQIDGPTSTHPMKKNLSDPPKPVRADG